MEEVGAAWCLHWHTGDVLWLVAPCTLVQEHTQREDSPHSPGPFFRVKPASVLLHSSECSTCCIGKCCPVLLPNAAQCPVLPSSCVDTTAASSVPGLVIPWGLLPAQVSDPLQGLLCQVWLSQFLAQGRWFWAHTS